MSFSTEMDKFKTVQCQAGCQTAARYEHCAGSCWYQAVAAIASACRAFGNIDIMRGIYRVIAHDIVTVNAELF